VSGHHDRNMEVSPEQVGTCSSKKVWWRHTCPKTGEEHEWQTKVHAVYKTYMSEGKGIMSTCCCKPGSAGLESLGLLAL
jgi:hypothetical protein